MAHFPLCVPHGQDLTGGLVNLISQNFPKFAIFLAHLCPFTSVRGPLSPLMTVFPLLYMAKLVPARIGLAGSSRLKDIMSINLKLNFVNC